MTTSQLVVTALGLLAIVWVNFYFFGSRQAAALPTTGEGSTPQRIRVEVKGGYSPSLIQVRAGRPVRLEFFRNETNSCTEEVVLPDFGIRTYLPAQETTAVEFTPTRPGRYEFVCGMGMVRGSIEVVT